MSNFGKNYFEFVSAVQEEISYSCADPEGGGGGRGSAPPPEKSQKYRVFSNTGLDPLKITKLQSYKDSL